MFSPEIASARNRSYLKKTKWLPTVPANAERCYCLLSEGLTMGPLEHANNKELLSTLAGAPAAGVLMEKFGGLTSLAQASFDELQSVKGIGKSKAAAIKSAFLLAQRLSRETYGPAPILDTPERVADFLRESNRLYTVENFQVVFLNTRRRLIGMEIISQGTLDTILVSPREVFYSAICRKAAAIALAHCLCAAAHKLCYVKRRVMCSGIAVASSRRRRMRCIESPGLHIIKAPITRQGGRGVSATSDRACLGLGSVSPPTEAFCVSSPGQSRHSCWSSRWRHGPARNGSC